MYPRLLVLFNYFRRRPTARNIYARGVVHNIKRAIYQDVINKISYSSFSEVYFTGNETSLYDDLDFSYIKKVTRVKIPNDIPDLKKINQVVEKLLEQSNAPIVILFAEYPMLTHDLLNQAYEKTFTRSVVVGPSLHGSLYLYGFSNLFQYSNFEKILMKELCVTQLFDYHKDVELTILPRLERVANLPQALSLKDAIKKEFIKDVPSNTAKALEAL